MPDFADLYAVAFRLIRERPFICAIVVVVSAGAGVAADLAPDNALIEALVFFSLLYLYLQAFLTAAVLGLEPARLATRRFVSLIGLFLIFNAGFLLGLLFFILPGLVLFLRWSVSLPSLIAEETSAARSLSRSWTLTAGRWWLALPVLAIALVGQGPTTYLYWTTDYPISAPLWQIVSLNLFLALMIIFEWLLIVALYLVLRQESQPGDFQSIFS